ncbi:hypothetical protein ORV05_09315 [Amycolatopsis cynarae]|uniref:HTH luxR-type domain-containing protein n=1 Tax=Amycolatopsis cynarae TaxID=2995223 RepID=A0ABY7B6L4_9PSEU|nr:hypothetical protein [Amycolatopsis sp. HUAS 11-8]WAL67950.1 hypothetical protein ORV05_09315 [Amycolatopsis sp. HUAS 11-8]
MSREVLLDEIELRVAELALHGTATPTIAEVLGVSTNAAAGHLATVYRKLGKARCGDAGPGR